MRSICLDKPQISSSNFDIIDTNIKELIDKGYNFFGENKVQEANYKFKNFNTNNLDLHLIGPLQTNKVKLAVKIFDFIHSVDSKNLPKKLLMSSLK